MSIKLASQFRVFTLQCSRFAHTLVVLRHGESEWNRENRFTGWFDTPLTEKGRQEACRAGKDIKACDLRFDVAYTSMLCRARETLTIVLTESCNEDIPVCTSWRLNERHYGNLTGMNKDEAGEIFGRETVFNWRRQYTAIPPAMDCDNPYFRCIIQDPRYKEEPSIVDFPVAESLQMTEARVAPFWHKNISKYLRAGKTILIVAHCNSIRCLIKIIEELSETQIVDMNIPTGVPFIYDLDEDLKPCTPLRFIGDEETVRKATEFFHKREVLKKVKQAKKSEKPKKEKCPE